MSNNNNHVIVFIDRVATKNKLQIDILHSLGFSVTFFVNAYNSNIDFLNPNDSQIKLEQSFISRLQQVSSYLKYKKSNLSHVEIYPGGRFSFIYLILAFLFRISTVCVERGDLLYFNKDGYDIITRFSMWVCYKFSDIVWYRETYMEPILRKMNVKRLFFLHNAIQFPTNHTFLRLSQKGIDFLWVNRLIPERKSEWLISIFQKAEFKNLNNVMAGFLSKTSYQKEQAYVQNNKPANLQILEYVTNPSELYLNAKFFVLPAKIVFANNALLEAMSYGVVPIVTKAPGVDLIIKNGVNGFVSDFDEASFEVVMKKALSMDEDQYEQMSRSAKNHVMNKFSPEIYKERLTELYHLIQS